MIRKLEQSHGDLLAYEGAGKLTEEENSAAIKEMREAIAQHGKIRLFVRVRGIPTPELAAMGERWRFAREHLSDIDRYALVGDNRVYKWLFKIADAFTEMEMRYFPLKDETKAWEWLGESAVAAGSGSGHSQSEPARG
jgi:hypothetical protein